MENLTTRGHLWDRKTLFKILILLIWLAIVIFAVTRHEFWRDEVRDLSIARSVSSPFELIKATQNEGHPVLWYLLLYAGNLISHSPLILPIISILISFASVILLVFRSPFKLWITCLLIFSSLVIYEDSVMARPYGLSLLLLIIIAFLYRQRQKHPIWLAVMLALLANANVQSALLTGLISLLWVVDIVKDWKLPGSRRIKWLTMISLMIVILGLLACAYCVIPRGNSLFAPIREGFTFKNILSAALVALVRPDISFSLLLPAFLPPLALILLYVITLLGLGKRPMLLLIALLAQVAFGILFQLIYPASARHQGVFVVFLFFLYWLLLDSKSGSTPQKLKSELPLQIGLNIGFTFILLGSCISLKDTLWRDITGISSSSTALGHFLTSSPEYQNAIIVPEPDYLIDALPYYAGNLIYYPREGRFGTFVSWTTDSKTHLSLAELVLQAKNLQKDKNAPVLIVLGFSQIKANSSAEIDFSYNKTFSWKVAERSDFFNTTEQVAAFTSAYGDENYTVFQVK